MTIPQRKGAPLVVDKDEHPRPDTTLEALGRTQADREARRDGDGGKCVGHQRRRVRVAAGVRSGGKNTGLTPKARVVASAAAGVAPRVMGIGPVPASRKALQRAGLSIGDMDVIELNEAFAAQGAGGVCGSWVWLTIRRKVNPNGGAIAIGHPLGASGGRLVTTALYQLQRTKGRYALCTMCIGVGQGIAMVVERI